MNVKIDINELSYHTFSGGELDINIAEYQIHNEDTVLLTCVIKNSEDLMKLVLVCDAVRQYDPLDVFIYIPYLPYGRQDKIFNVGEALSLRAIGAILSSMKYSKIYTLDVHNEKAYAYISKLVNLQQHHLFEHTFLPDQIIVAVDEGSIQKVTSIARINHINAVYLCKKRNPTTRKIEMSIDFYAESILEGKDCIITDDICDGGRTFISAAKLLKKAGCNNIYLYVSHGIFSYGLDELYNAGITHITCGDHMLDEHFIDEINSYESDGLITIYDTKERGI